MLHRHRYFCLFFFHLLFFSYPFFSLLLSVSMMPQKCCETARQNWPFLPLGRDSVYTIAPKTLRKKGLCFTEQEGRPHGWWWWSSSLGARIPVLFFQCSHVKASAQGWSEWGRLWEARPAISVSGVVPRPVPLNRGSYLLSFNGVFAFIQIRGLGTGRGFVTCFFYLLSLRGK